MIIDRPTAYELLVLLGYGGAAFPPKIEHPEIPPALPQPPTITVADLMLDLADMRREIKALNTEINHIGSYYRGFKLNEVETENALNALGVPADQIQKLITIWSVDRIQPIRLPTTNQISKAVKYGTLTVDEAIAKLELLGYTAYDASIVLSAEGEVKIATLPPQSPVPPPAGPLPVV